MARRWEEETRGYRSIEELAQNSSLKWQVTTRQCPIWDVQRTVLWWHKNTISRLVLSLENREFSIPLLGKEAFDHFAQSSVTLQPLQGVLSEGPFIPVAGIFLSSFSPIIHGALTSHSPPPANTAWVCNQIPEVTVSKAMCYLWIAPVSVYILICYLSGQANWGEEKEKRKAEGSSISCLNKFRLRGVVQAKIQCDWVLPYEEKPRLKQKTLFQSFANLLNITTIVLA